MERRPIASRETNWAEKAAVAIARTGLTPNSISILGLVFALLAGACFYFSDKLFWPTPLLFVLGAILVQFRLLANLFDGMVAQIQKSSSPVGELYNEVPDRVSDVLILVGFGYAVGGSPLLGWTTAVLALFIAYLRALMAVSGVPQIYVGPMSKSHRMATVTIAALLAAAFSKWEVPTYALCGIVVGEIVTIIRRLSLGANHLNASPSPSEQTDEP